MSVQIAAVPDRENRFAALNPENLNELERETIISIAVGILEKRHKPGELLSSPEITMNYLRLLLADLENEVFGCLYLDVRHRIVGHENIFQGTVDGTAVYPRVVVQRALKANAGAMVLYHCHPFGTYDKYHNR